MKIVKGFKFFGLVGFNWVEMHKVDFIGVWYLDLFDFVAFEWVEWPTGDTRCVD